MTSSEEIPSEERLPKPLTVKACSLPEGNATEFSFPLSIYGAWMLREGIANYAETTMAMYERGQEDPGYCAMCTATALTEAEKLVAWAKQVDEEYLEGTIESLQQLISELKAEMDRFVALMEETRLGEENSSGEGIQ